MTTFFIVCSLLIIVLFGIRSMIQDQGKRDQPKGMASGMFASMDEIFHPNAHEAHIVIEEKEREIAPKPAPVYKNFQN